MLQVRFFGARPWAIGDLLYVVKQGGTDHEVARFFVDCNSVR